MKLNPGTQNFWNQLGNIGFFILLLVAIAYSLAGFKAAFVVGVLGLLSAIAFIHTVKMAILASQPDSFDVEPAHLDDCPNLDRAWFQHTTTALEALGFEQLRDYKLRHTSLEGMARCFSHPTALCFCEINQSCAQNQAPASTCVILSFMEDHWSLAHINQPVAIANSLSYLWRSPKGVVVFNPTNDESSIKQVFQRHLQFRQAMMQDLGIALQTDVAWETYQAHEQARAVYRKQLLKRRNLLLCMIEVTRFELHPKALWLGAYGRHYQSHQRPPAPTP